METQAGNISQFNSNPFIFNIIKVFSDKPSNYTVHLWGNAISVVNYLKFIFSKFQK